MFPGRALLVGAALSVIVACVSGSSSLRTQTATTAATLPSEPGSRPGPREGRRQDTVGAQPAVAIDSAFAVDPALGSQSLYATAEGGDVTLHGWVRTLAAKLRAVSLVEGHR